MSMSMSLGASLPFPLVYPNPFLPSNVPVWLPCRHGWFRRRYREREQVLPIALARTRHRGAPREKSKESSGKTQGGPEARKAF